MRDVLGLRLGFPNRDDLDQMSGPDLHAMIESR